MSPPTPTTGPSPPPEDPEAPRPGAVPVLAVALTAAIALSASMALAWAIRGWTEGPGPSVEADADAGGPGTSLPRAGPPDAGRLAYQVHCARCHGAEGHGDGSDAERLRPPPRDFASADGWRSTPTADSIRRVVVSGLPGTAMPGWGESLSRRELDGLVAHVLSLAPGHAPGPDRAGFVMEPSPGPAPPLSLLDLDGRPASLDERRGRPVLVLFWGTTCAHCLDEIPDALRFADRRRDRGLDLLPVCVDETDPTVVRDVVGPRRGRQPLYLDPSGTARLRYDVQALPAFALIDRSGRLVARAQGARDWDDPALDALIPP